MAKKVRKRLPKLERRDQLLAIAREIIIDEGAASLTLGHLAERASVTKPITYGHFGSRTNLLKSLYEELHNHHLAELARALSNAQQSLKDIAGIAADTFVHCAANDPYTYAVTAALNGDAEGKQFYSKLAQEYVQFYVTVFRPFCRAGDEDFALLCVGVVGAAEAIATEMIEGRTNQSAAARNLANLIVGTFEITESAG